jgi:hypothetical protein
MLLLAVQCLANKLDGNLSELENLVEHRIHTAYASPNSVPPRCWFLKSTQPGWIFVSNQKGKRKEGGFEGQGESDAV